MKGKLKKIRVGVFGAAGFAGQELVQMLIADQFCEIVFLHSRSNQEKKISGKILENLGIDEILARKPDCIFFATPAGVCQKFAKKFLENKIKIIDLGADFRFFDKEIFEKTYRLKFENPGENPVFGVPEFFSEKIKKAKLIANPGCFVISALLAAFPIADFFSTAVFDSKTGFSGAGVKKFSEISKKINNNFYPYLISGHRHEAEIQQFFKKPIFFTPHLLPIFRGICTTAHFFIPKKFENFDFLKYFQEFFADKKYIKVQKNIPEISEIQNKNSAILGGFENKNGKLTIISVLDNLKKGASSNALQNMHQMFSLPEKIPEISLDQIVT